ncbi:MAG: Fe-only nitrogenase accessory protein AnfO [Zymomonas mobilis subsp. pomaceae]|uniref:Fe-only nitrogenase accessory protein AnfO n=1 Tax=Zymomonas mobilis subsp. pomaceae (strain ATCC 29192 / DSM 22645 / JCM 10191 / CCUG 17912 / NBRC 13757 / NCIMB 11200 / NRRL B-4491 / Barker I) TaxID=579138 RepID=F8EST5_ZYMMT|nr:Fe-only nitrogenase accessory protein AnfO [Zymomonas mobilis]AEI37860.1 Fe-only nitrogenase accessory protein AnfO [Zymomonas mobilis subsp. pomaceae ATCC 29192]MDX5949227.1 Fe-only nitrogenase accessory protein AnfO [Zymomonas mobilis subsp. pomaceae]GEB89544.1 Fe-only nitrogenase accessory protein AnfO [Zymomonas mobilis subsp. pomaceae]
MKIAVYINDQGEVATFREKGSVRLYESCDGKWRAEKEIPFSLVDVTTLGGIRQALLNLIKELEDCTTFLSGDINGIAYVFLRDEMGFSIWKSEGSLEEQINIVAQKEQEARTIAKLKGDCSKGCCPTGGKKHGDAEKSECPPDMTPFLVKMNDEGDYTLSLIEVMKLNPSLNSREILIPIMEDFPFRKLEILCDHLPKWFTKKSDDLHLTAEIEASDRLENGVKATLMHAPA